MAPRSRIIGCGSYLPERVLTNDELARKLDTSDEWITARTGIRQRHIAAAGELTSDLAYQAARQALESAAIGAEELDLIVLATTTPDNTFPATATKVQALLEVNRGAAFDVQAVIFGDGAGAVVVRAGEEGEGGGQERGILSFHLHSDGRLGDLLFVDGGPSSTQTVGTVKMSGREVFRHAVVNLADVALEALEANGLTIGDVDWLVPHQANKRILESTARKLGLPAERVVVTVDRHANTSAASIPLALEEAVGDGRIRPGHLVLMEAMGAGMTWGAGLVRW
jgi:3-oxoacyl-[acyl-carrier-protein] synthase-3